MSAVVLREQPRAVIARKTNGTVILLRQMIAGTAGATGATGATGAAGPNSISDTTALGSLTNDTAPLFLLSGKAGTGDFARKTTPTATGLSLLLAANNAAVLALLGTGTPGSGNFLRGDGSWQAVNGMAIGGTVTSATAGRFLLVGAGPVLAETSLLTLSGTVVTHSGTSRFTGSVTESAQTLNRTDLGVEAGTPRLVMEASGSTIWVIDNSSGTLRIRTSGQELCRFSSGLFNSTTNVLIGGNSGDTANPFSERFAVKANVGGTTGTQVTSSFGQGTNGTPANDFGGSLRLTIDTSTTELVTAADLRWGWADATHATRAAWVELGGYSTTTYQPGVRVQANSGGVRLGFFAATPVAKPTGVPVTAADIHAALVSLGLIAA